DPYEVFDRHCIGWHENTHVGYHSHAGNVLYLLVRGAVGAYCEAAMGNNKLDVELGIADCIADLVDASAGNECRIGARKCDLASYRETCGNRYEVGFCDSNIKHPLWILVAKLFGLERIGCVATDADNSGVVLSKLH